MNTMDKYLSKICTQAVADTITLPDTTKQNIKETSIMMRTDTLETSTVQESEENVIPLKKKDRLTQLVPPSAVAKVNAIREQALRLGWREDRLYQNHGRFRFPCGGDYGLVCFVDENRRIGKVTRQYIEIIGSPPLNIVHRFSNPDVDQPWCKKIKNV